MNRFYVLLPVLVIGLVRDTQLGWYLEATLTLVPDFIVIIFWLHGTMQVSIRCYRDR